MIALDMTPLPDRHPARGGRPIVRRPDPADFDGDDGIGCERD